MAVHLEQLVAAELESEVVSRLGVLGLVGADLFGEAVFRAPEECRAFAGLLVGKDRERAARVASDVFVALWPDGWCPLDWWLGYLGRAVAATGFDPGGLVGVRAVVAELGVPLGTLDSWGIEFPAPTRLILDRLV